MIQEDGNTWSVLAGYGIDGYLPCVGIRKGYYNTEAFLAWVVGELLPQYNAFPGPRSVMCLDNCSAHINPRVRQAIEEKGCLIRYLPPYLPDYNPIELSWSMLKVWLRRHFRQLRRQHSDGFGALLIHAIAESICNRKVKEHFEHSAGGLYRFEGDLEQFQRQLEVWSLEQSNI